MKAMVYTRYGEPEVLSMAEVPKPTPGPEEILVKVHAASINSWDWDLLRGKPFIVRLAGGGLTKPKKTVLGCDLAGEVVSVGEKVSRFRPGDLVYGDLSAAGWGGFAEYACGPENAFVKKPEAMSFEQAAAIPQAGVMALQGVQDFGEVQPGQQVLINGAGGGVGSFAIPLAKLAGAIITGVDHSGKFDMMRKLGADHLVDYQQEDFTHNGKEYDLILDPVGHHSFFDYRRALKPGGAYWMIGGQSGLMLQLLLLGPLLSRLGKKKLGILAHQPNKGLDTLNWLFETGKLIPAVDRVFRLEALPEAFLYFGENRFCGKVVVRVAGGEKGKEEVGLSRK